MVGGDRPIFNMAKSIWRSQYIDTSSLDRQRRRIDRPDMDVGVFLFLFLGRIQLILIR